MIADFILTFLGGELRRALMILVVVCSPFMIEKIGFIDPSGSPTWLIQWQLWAERHIRFGNGLSPVELLGPWFLEENMGDVKWKRQLSFSRARQLNWVVEQWSEAIVQNLGAGRDVQSGKAEVWKSKEPHPFWIQSSLPLLGHCWSGLWALRILGPIPLLHLWLCLVPWADPQKRWHKEVREHPWFLGLKIFAVASCGCFLGARVGRVV